MKVEIKPYQDRCRNYYIDGEFRGVLYFENGMTKTTGDTSGIKVALLFDAVADFDLWHSVIFDISFKYS